MRLLRIVYKKGFAALFWIALMLAFESGFMCVLTIIAAAIHECGHIACAHLFTKGGVRAPRATLRGLKIDTGAALSYKEECVVALAGPLANILAALASLPLLGSPYMLAFLIVNLLCALSNLLPLREYDGARIIRSLLLHKLTPHLTERIMSGISLAVSYLLVTLSLTLLMHLGEGYWLLVISMAVFLGEILRQH